LVGQEGLEPSIISVTEK